MAERHGQHPSMCTVAVYQARFWYDGSYVNNAKEDAAYVALSKLRGVGIASSKAVEGGTAAEEEKKEPEDESMPEGAIARVGEDILD